MPKARTLHPSDKANADNGTIVLGQGDAIPTNFGACIFWATNGSAVMSKCNGWSYSGKALTDPCKIVGKDLGDGPHYVAGEIDDVTIDSGNVTFVLVEDLNN